MKGTNPTILLPGQIQQFLTFVWQRALEKEISEFKPVKHRLKIDLLSHPVYSQEFGVYIYIYIVIHRQTVSFYQNSSVWLDT